LNTNSFYTVTVVSSMEYVVSCFGKCQIA